MDGLDERMASGNHHRRTRMAGRDETADQSRLLGAIQREGRTLIPTRLYFNEKGMAKLELALAKGKKIHDKRETVADRDWKREQGRLLREKG